MILEKEKLIADERKRLKAESDRNLENSLIAEDIVLQNKLVMEAKQRMEFEARQAADSQRLHDIQRKVRGHITMCSQHVDSQSGVSYLTSVQPLTLYHRLFLRLNRDRGKRNCSQHVRPEKKRKKISFSRGACRDL